MTPSKNNWNNWNWNKNALRVSSKIQKHSKIRYCCKSAISRFYSQKQDNYSQLRAVLGLKKHTRNSILSIVHPQKRLSQSSGKFSLQHQIEVF